MRTLLLRTRGIFIALIALALSASLAFGAQPPEAASFGLETAASHAGKTVPEVPTDPETTEDEEVDEEVDEETDEEPAQEEEEEEAPEVEDEEVDEVDDNCLTDPTGLSEEELAAMNHGSIVCWAANQETPEGYANHGAWVSEWARAGNGGDDSDDDTEAATSRGQGKGKGNAPQGRP